MGVVTRGRGRPLTLFVPGGEGDHLDRRMRYADRVAGTTIGFAYERSGHFDAFARLRRQADRDAGEVGALAAPHDVRRAIGFSRGARAVEGALALDPGIFDRVALVLPPGGVAAGTYSVWLQSLASTGRGDPRAEILVVGHRGDQGHPARVAREWADRLGARLELLPSRAVCADVERVQDLLGDVFN